MQMFQQIVHFFQDGGIFMYPLALCSVVLVTAIVYRILNVRTSSIAPQSLVKLIRESSSDPESVNQLEMVARSSRSPLGRLVQTVFEYREADEMALTTIVESKAKEEFVKLQSGLPLIEMIIMIAPMFGILGTASGLVIVFAAFGLEDNSGQIARGISNALNTTIAGLAIAAPAVIANVCFTHHLERISTKMEAIIAELIACRAKR